MSGTCEKFPNFQFVMGECGAAWIPFVLGRMDHRYMDGGYNGKFDPPLTVLASEYWYRQGSTTFQEEPYAGHIVDLIGETNVIWGSDYPHPDCVWPDSRRVINDNLGHLEECVLKKIVCENTAKLYGFPH